MASNPSNPTRSEDNPAAEKSQSQSTSPSQRPPRIKSIPKKLHSGIDRSIPGISKEIPQSSSKAVSATSSRSKSVSFREPIATPLGKRKEPTPESISKPKKKARMKRASNFEPETGPDTSQRKKTSGSGQRQNPQPESSSSSSVMVNAIDDIYRTLSPPISFDFSSVNLKDQDNLFKEKFATREFCAVVSLDLSKFEQENNLNLRPWLSFYENFISIDCPYSPTLVRQFYSNMVYDNVLDSEGELIEERISTKVRHTKFSLSASTLNKILKLDQFPIHESDYSNREIWSALMPHKPFPDDQHQTLTLSPSSMTPRNRVLWYIFSRNFIQKGGNFTHFAQRDYPLFTSFVNKIPFNLGHHIFKEMIKFKFPTRKLSHMPFPSLISVILFYFKIWHIGTNEDMKAPPHFDKGKLNLMNLVFEGEGSGQSKAPTKSKAPPRSFARASQAQSQSFYQEVQSAPPPLSTDFEDKIKEIINSTVRDMSQRIISEIEQLKGEQVRGTKQLVEVQDAMKQDLVRMKIDLDELSTQTTKISNLAHEHDITLTSLSVSNASLHDKMDQLLQHFNISLSTSFGTTSNPQPSGAPGDSTPPIASTPILDPHPSEPIPESSEVPPSQAEDGSFISKSSSFTPAGLPPSHIISPTPLTIVPPSSDDDKGGEDLSLALNQI